MSFNFQNVLGFGALGGLFKHGLNDNFGNSGDNPFQNMSFDRGSGIDPFNALRQALPGQVFGQANIFGQQGSGFLNSRGMFDPNMAEAIRLRAFGGAQQNLMQALAGLAGQEGQFREGQRQFNIGTDIQLKDLSEQWKASQPGILDWLTGGANAAAGAANFLPFIL